MTYENAQYTVKQSTTHTDKWIFTSKINGRRFLQNVSATWLKDQGYTKVEQNQNENANATI